MDPMHIQRTMLHETNGSGMSEYPERTSNIMMPQFSGGDTMVSCLERPATNNIMVFNLHPPPAPGIAANPHVYSLLPRSGRKAQGDFEMHHGHTHRSEPESHVYVHGPNQPQDEEEPQWLPRQNYSENHSVPVLKYASRGELDLAPTSVPADLHHIYFPCGPLVHPVVSLPGLAPVSEQRYMFSSGNAASECSSSSRSHSYAMDNRMKTTETASVTRRKPFTHQVFHYKPSSSKERYSLEVENLVQQGLMGHGREIEQEFPPPPPPPPPPPSHPSKPPQHIRYLIPITSSCQLSKGNIALLQSVKSSAGSRDIHSTGSRDVHSTGSRDVHSAGSRDVHSAGSRDVHTAGSHDVHLVGSRDFHSTGSRDVHSVGSRDIHSSGSHDVHLVGSRDVHSTGSRDVHSVGSRDIHSTGSHDVHLVGSRDVHSLASHDVHTVGPRDVHSSGSHDVHTVGPRDVHSSGSRDVHSSGSRDVHSVGSRDIHSSGSRDVHSVASRDIHSSGSRDVHSAPSDIPISFIKPQPRKSVVLATSGSHQPMAPALPQTHSASAQMPTALVAVPIPSTSAPAFVQSAEGSEFANTSNTSPSEVEVQALPNTVPVDLSDEAASLEAALSAPLQLRSRFVNSTSGMKMATISPMQMNSVAPRLISPGHTVTVSSSSAAPCISHTSSMHQGQAALLVSSSDVPNKNSLVLLSPAQSKKGQGAIQEPASRQGAAAGSVGANEQLSHSGSAVICQLNLTSSYRLIDGRLICQIPTTPKLDPANPLPSDVLSTSKVTSNTAACMNNVVQEGQQNPQPQVHIQSSSRSPEGPATKRRRNDAASPSTDFIVTKTNDSAPVTATVTSSREMENALPHRKINLQGKLMETLQKVEAPSRVMSQEELSGVESETAGTSATESSADTGSATSLRILETVSLAGLENDDSAGLADDDALSQNLQRLSGEGFYRCGCQDGQCTFTSQLQSQFERHLLQVHNHETEFLCIHCGGRERCVDSLLFHLDQHLDGQRFSLYCSKASCDFHSYSPRHVLIHMAATHCDLTQASHTCWQCARVFPSLLQFNAHVMASLLQVALCPYCDSKDTSGPRIKQHIITQHPGRVRVIAFHKMLVCREKKMTGWASGEEMRESKEVCLSTVGTEHLPDIKNGSPKSKVQIFADRNLAALITDPSCSLKTRAGGKEGSRKTSLRELAYDKDLPSQDCQDVNARNKTPDKFWSCTSRSRQSQNVSDSGGKWSEPEENLNDSVERLKRLLKGCRRRKNEGGRSDRMDCSPSLRDIRSAEQSSKMSMEPMDYEISADGKLVEEESCEEDDEVQQSTSQQSVTTSISTQSSNLPGDDEQLKKQYTCTLSSAGNTIRIMSTTAHNSLATSTTSVNETKSNTSNSTPKLKKVNRRKSSHPQRQPQALKRYTCMLCWFTSNFSPGIYQHMYNKHREILQCPICKSHSTNRTAFQEHLNREHPAEAKRIYHERRVTKWISIKKLASPPKKVGRPAQKGTLSPEPSPSSQAVNPVKMLNDQDYPVKDYFVVSGHAMDRTFRCVFCDFSFHKLERSNANIYRSMYKHMFLMHIPHLLQCPLCAYTNRVEDKVKRHIDKAHSNSADYDSLQPQVVLLPSTADQRRRTDHYHSIINKTETSATVPPTTDIPHAECKDEAPAETSVDATWEEISLEVDPHSSPPPQPAPVPVPQVPSQSVFPQRERVPSYMLHCGPSLETPDSQDSTVSTLSSVTSESAEEGAGTSEFKLIPPRKVASPTQPRPRDFYTVECLGQTQVFRCLRCNYTRMGVKGRLSARASTIFHVRRIHMNKKDAWRCGTCNWRTFKESRMRKHCKKVHAGKAEIIKDASFLS